jgi:hypothetical protein
LKKKVLGTNPAILSNGFVVAVFVNALSLPPLAVFFLVFVGTVECVFSSFFAFLSSVEQQCS